MAEVAIGQRVYIRPTRMASDEFREKITSVGLDRKRIAVVLDRTRTGSCVLLLPSGVSVPGHSHGFPPGTKYAGHEYLDVHESHLQPL